MKKSILTIIIIAIISIALSGCNSTQQTETWRLGDYKGEYIGFRLEEKGEDTDILVTRFEFTNYSNEPISFISALNPTLYQSGSELVRMDDEVDIAATPVPPGETHSIDIKYYLPDKKELIVISIKNSVTGETYSVKTACEK